MNQQPITYQQLLAEQYEENANQILAFTQTEYTHEEHESSEYIIDTYAPNRVVKGHELEDPHLFQQFAGNRNLEEDIIQPGNFEDKSKLSVRYNKDVKLNTYNIDSRFRAYVIPGVLSSNAMINPANPVNQIAFDPTAVSSASHFIFRIPRQVKNAISVKLSSLELPNTFSNFSASRGNTIFQIRNHGDPTYYDVNIDSDGISQYIPTPELLVAAIQTSLRSLPAIVFPQVATFTCELNTQGYIVIGNSEATEAHYDFNFGYSPLSVPLFDPLGVLMGFSSSSLSYQNVIIDATHSLTAMYLPDLNTDDYIYLRINDYSTVIPQTLNDTYFNVFAKIPVTVNKGQVIYDNDSTNSTNKTYRFLLPTNIQQLDIQLLDRGGDELVFEGNYSMTLEIEEVLSQTLYEKMREL